MFYPTTRACDELVYKQGVGRKIVLQITTTPLINTETILGVPSEAARQIAVIKKHYQAHDWHRVESYLQADPLSAQLLVEAERHLPRVFGDSVEVFLDVTPDPSGIDHPFLYARIRTGEPRREVSKKLHRFDEEWWLDAGAGVDARLEFTVATPPAGEQAVAV